MKQSETRVFKSPCNYYYILTHRIKIVVQVISLWRPNFMFHDYSSSGSKSLMSAKAGYVFLKKPAMWRP